MSRSLKESVEILSLAPHEQVSERICKQIVHIPLSQVTEHVCRVFFCDCASASDFDRDCQASFEWCEAVGALFTVLTVHAPACIVFSFFF